MAPKQSGLGLKGPRFISGAADSSAQAWTGVDAQVDALVVKYAAITRLTDTVAELARTPGYLNLLHEVFDHYIALIKTRPATVEEGHITVYDKALLVLTSHGKVPYSMGAIELFKHEILGIGDHRDMAKVDTMFSKNIALRAILGQVTGRAETSANIVHRQERKAVASPARAIEPPPSRPRYTDGSPKAEQVEMTLRTFEMAQVEYEAIHDSDVERKAMAAKFLRDSAENAHKYLYEYDPGHYMVEILVETLEMTQEKAIAEHRRRYREPEKVQSRVYRRYRNRNFQKTVKLNRRQQISDCYRP
ncbi:hypothetical protein FQN57_000731 [Myotisia sp. PD_48]|nr:hypothetical protein FQN57_000731 [Myotisia sp. PD_48]